MTINIPDSLATIPWLVWVFIGMVFLGCALNERRNRKWEAEKRRREYEKFERDWDEMFGHLWDQK